jgi:RNA polymerase sigma-70 factor (ECF subfamily)
LNLQNDTGLILRLQQNEVEAFDALYETYHAGIYANVLKLVKNESATEDIVQEVFIKLWEKRMSLDSKQPVAGWLFVVSFNRSVDFLKQKLKESTAQIDFNNNLFTATDTDFELKEAQWAFVEKAINGLSPQKRKVFELCKLQGKSYEETAAELQISKHTVKEYLSGAISSIKEYMKQHAGEGPALLASLLLLRFIS